MKVAQSHPTLCNPMDYTVHGLLQARILEWLAFPFSTVFSTQGLNPGLPHCRQILYQLSHKGSPRILHWVAYPFSSGSSWISCIAGGFFTNWANCIYKSTIRKEMFQNIALQGCLSVYAKNESPMNLKLMFISKMCWFGVSWWFNIAFRLQGEEVCRISIESALKRTVVKESQKCPK